MISPLTITEKEKPAWRSLENHYRIKARLGAAYACEGDNKERDKHASNLKQINESICLLEKEMEVGKEKLGVAEEEIYRNECMYMIESDDVSKNEKNYVWKMLQERKSRLKSDLENKVSLLVRHLALELLKEEVSSIEGKEYKRTFEIGEEFEKLKEKFYSAGNITEKVSLYQEVMDDIPKIAINTSKSISEELRKYWINKEKNCSICEYMHKTINGKDRPTDELVDENKWCGFYPELSGTRDYEQIKKCDYFKEYISLPKAFENKIDFLEELIKKNIEKTAGADK